MPKYMSGLYPPSSTADSTSSKYHYGRRSCGCACRECLELRRSARAVSWKASWRRGGDIHMGTLSAQTTTCTAPRALKTGVALVPLVTSHSYALKVRAKLNMFLKMIMQVKPSMARSPVTQMNLVSIYTNERGVMTVLTVRIHNVKTTRHGTDNHAAHLEAKEHQRHDVTPFAV